MLHISSLMHTIRPAQLKPGTTLDDLPQPEVAAGGAAASPDPRPGADLLGSEERRRRKKLDAIDTDQITPAADCVSESLDTLDERWKAGSFRYLMPDFRARVHRGQTFVIAGDRFAIGSSREMSPAGLKGVAEEAGLEMVDRLRQQHGRHLPPQRVQPRAARGAEPRGGRRRAGRRRVHVRSGDARAHERRRRASATTPVPLSPKEEEIRRGGGIFAVGRREFRASVETRAVDRLAGCRRRAPA